MMTLKRTYENLEIKNRFDSKIADYDCEYYVTGVIPGAENVVIKKMLEKVLKSLEKFENSVDIIECLKIMINNDECYFDACYNEMKNGGGAYEIEINDYNDGTMSIYFRIAEHMHEDPAEEPTEETAEETAEDFSEIFEEYYRDFHICGTDTVGYTARDPWNHYAPVSFDTIQEARNAVDDCISQIEERDGEPWPFPKTPEDFEEVVEAAIIEEVENELYADLKGCTDCSKCRRNCEHKNAFRRLPRSSGGLGLCKNL